LPRVQCGALAGIKPYQARARVAVLSSRYRCPVFANKGSNT
jgi:hypothetical protein